MEYEQFDKLREFVKWVGIEIRRPANVELNSWSFPHLTDEETMEYRIWVDGVIHAHSTNIDELIERIPEFKLMCQKVKG